MRIFHFAFAALLIASAVYSQTTKDPFPAPIPATDGAILVKFVEFAAIPYAGGEAPRMMLLLDEPGTHRLFVNTMQGAIYSISYDGKTVTPYLDINAPEWGVNVQFSSHDRGFQSFAFHPQFNQRGTRGYGKFYTYTDTANMTKKADFLPNGPGHTHDTVLLEWTAKNPEAATYDGGTPREIFRTAKPFPIHNGGQLAFNPLAKPGSADYGLLYVGVADGGNGGDPYKHAQNLSVAFGKILRIDPLGSNSANGQYGIPSINPFVKNAQTRSARRDLCVRLPESAALLVGSEERQHVSGGHRPGSRREGYAGHARREPWVEHLGRQLYVWPGQGGHGKSARRLRRLHIRSWSSITPTRFSSAAWRSPASLLIGTLRFRNLRTSCYLAITLAARFFMWMPTICRRVGRMQFGGFYLMTRARRKRCFSLFRRRIGCKVRHRRDALICGLMLGRVGRYSCLIRLMGLFGCWFREPSARGLLKFLRYGDQRSLPRS